MNDQELIRLWQKTWSRIVISQIAPTVLLITTVALMQFGLGESPYLVRVAAVLILLASGVLGAMAQYSAAVEAQSIASQLGDGANPSPIAGSIANLAKLLWVVKFVTPAIFIAIFVAITVFALS